MREPSASNTWTRYQTHFARVTSRLYKPFSCPMQSRACDTRYCSSVIKWDGARKRKRKKRVQFNNFSSKKKTTTTTTTRKAWPEYDQNDTRYCSSVIKWDGARKRKRKKRVQFNNFSSKKNNNNNNDDKKSLARIWPEFKVIIYYPARHAQQSVRWRAWMDWSAERWTEGETHASTTFHECLRNWCCYKFRLSVSFYTK